MPISRNVRQLLEDRVAASLEKVFLFSEADGRSWSYAAFDRVVNRTANMLRSHSVGKGDVVSLLMPNSAEYVIAYFACWKIGAVAGPVNSMLKGDEIVWAVRNSGSKLMLAGSEWSESVLPKALHQFPTVAIVTFDNVESVSKDFAETVEKIDLSEDDDAIIIYTSGTTGKPKGCLLTHGNLIANARQIARWMGFGKGDRLLTVMPLFHMNAVSVTTMTALYAGGSTVVSPKFSASRFWDVIKKYQVTSFGSVATMLSMLLSAADGLTRTGGASPVADSNPGPNTAAGGSDSLRFAMCGSAPVPAEVLRKFEAKFKCLVIEGYGLSESTCRSTFNPPNASRRPGSCGLPIGNEMKVFDENDKEVMDGELGEIVLRGANICKKYFKDPDATAKAFAGGWFHTGDVGYRDADGFFYIADRKSDMIIRGGENIYPREIDDLLYTHQAVAEAAVIGVPDEIYGEEVAAFVVLKIGAEASSDDLKAFCRQYLADYKCPKTVHFLKEIPKGPTGKILKKMLI